MALGGGTWFSQNKVLPGAYINFISKATARGALGERGVVAMGLKMGWGVDGEIFEVTAEDFVKNSLKLFGYDYKAPEMKGLRDLFLYAKKAYFYNLNSTTGTTSHATGTFGTAQHSGTCGNSIKIAVAVNADDSDLWDVTTYYNNVVVNVQTVATAAGLVDDDWVAYKTDATLTTTAATALSGGAEATITTAMHQAFLDKIESYSVNTVGVVNDEANGGISSLNALYAAWCRRMRDDLGIKLQVVVYNYAADYEGVVNVKNAVSDTDWSGASLVYWVTGLVAGTEINASAMNTAYNGEFTVGVEYTQSQLEGFITSGLFALHNVNGTIRVLCDINSLTTTTDDKGSVFKQNQTIRVIDEIATSIAGIFNTKYLGRVPNDADGRIALWADIVAHPRELAQIRAIDAFDDTAVTVDAGIEKGAVVVNDAITVIGAMEKLYMTCVVS